MIQRRRIPGRFLLRNATAKLHFVVIAMFLVGCHRSSDSLEIQRLRDEVAALKAEAARSQQLPTASELFDLRAKCAELGEKILAKNVIGPALTHSQVSHYNPKTGRCFVELTVENADLDSPKTIIHRYLIDGHTEAMLASQTADGEKKFGMVFNTNISGFLEAGEYIDKMMNDE